MKNVTRKFWTKLESQKSHTANHQLCQNLHVMSNKVKSGRTTGNNMFLVHDLNAFSACFEQKMGEITFSAQKALGGPVSTVPVADVKLTFLRVNPWKATSPSEVSSGILRTCTD